jgi:hypothetical protein
MANWRVDIIGAKIAQGVELRTSLFGHKIEAGDTFYSVNLEGQRGTGSVISAVPSDTIIMHGDDKWRIQYVTPDVCALSDESNDFGAPGQPWAVNSASPLLCYATRMNIHRDSVLHLRM